MDVAELFFDIVTCRGYESSIWPEIDTILTDAAGIERLQMRAFGCPELASGLVLHARNNKRKFASAARKHTLIELLWSHPHVRASGPLQSLHLFGGVDGGLFEKDGIATFAIPGRKIILLFWSHDWSGEVEVECDGKIMHKDLYSRWGGFMRVVLSDLAMEPHIVTIRSTGRKCANSHASQVIFYKAMAYCY